MTRTQTNPLSALAKAAKGDVWTPQVVRTLNRLLATDILLVDLKGSVLAAAPARSSIDPLILLTASTGQSTSIAVAPVQVADETVALLGCASESVVPEQLNFAASIIAADLRSHLKVLRAKDTEAAAAFQEALHATTDEGLADRLQAAGLDVDRPFRVLAGQISSGEDRLAAIAWNLHALLAEDSKVPSRMTIDGRLVTLVPDGAAVLQRAQRLCEQLRRLDPSAAVGISHAHAGVAGLRMAHAEAVYAAGLGAGVREGESLDVMTTALLGQLTPETVAAATGLLAPLIHYDKTHDGQLVETLRSWLEHDRSAPATAQAMFIHRNTLRYRLNQAEELIGLQLGSTTAITNLTLALRVTDGPQTAEKGARSVR